MSDLLKKAGMIYDYLKIKPWDGGAGSQSSGGRLEILIKSSASNCFTLSLFVSLLPLKIMKKPKAAAVKAKKSSRKQTGKKDGDQGDSDEDQEESKEVVQAVRPKMLAGCCLKTA